MEIEYKGIAQDWENETTRYLFIVDGEEYCLADQNGDFSLFDCDGKKLRLDCRATINRKIIRALVARLNKMMPEIDPNFKHIESWPTY